MFMWHMYLACDHTYYLDSSLEVNLDWEIRITPWKIGLLFGCSTN